VGSSEDGKDEACCVLHIQIQPRLSHATFHNKHGIIASLKSIIKGDKKDSMPHLHLPLDHKTQLVIFDKDGTLIDFHAMWATWVEELARRLETAAGITLAGYLFQTLGYDPATGHVVAGSHLALDPADEMRAVLAATLRAAGLTSAAAAHAVDVAWFTPDPVATARPLADLPMLFGTLRERGIRIAVATSDDHAPAAATLAGLGVAALVDAIVGADDGLPIKPAPDAVLAICRQLGVDPQRAVMVGDSADDLRMGRAAGAGLVVGVTSGVYSAELLAPYADVVLPSIAGLIA
jgi:phosphoglycolate phosphatase